MLTRARKLLLFTAVTIGTVPLSPLPAAAAPPPAPSLVSVALPGAGADVRTGTVEVGGTFDLAGVSYEGPAGADVELRASDDGRTWTPWTHLSDAREEGPDRGSPEAARARHTTQPVWTDEARFVQVRASSDVGTIRALRVHGVDVEGHGESTLDKVRRGVAALFRSAPSAGAPAAAMTDQPPIVTRAQWGADESIRKGNPSYGDVEFAVLHHTVSANGYSAAEAPGLIRGIYTYHVKTNGWDDIGYNFLVDRFGTIYEGRAGGVDRAVIGAHAGGFNSYSVGVSMLGTYSTVSPPAATVAAVQELMAWRLDVAHVDPVAKTTVVSKGSNKYPSGTSVTLDGIVGHRDLGTTDCPGDLGYRRLGAIRSAVASIGLPKMYDVEASDSTIEGRQRTSYESTTVSARGSEPLSWSVTVAHEVLGTVRSFTASGPTLSFAWDGTNDAGVNVPMGTYRITVRGSSANGTARAGTLAVRVVDLDLVKPVDRLFGGDRYSTAAAAAAEVASAGGGSVTDVVIASGDTRNLVDSLVAAPLTAAKSAPLLLTSPSSLPAATTAALDRLKPQRAWIVGGTVAVSSGVESALDKRGIDVRRLAGVDAPSTAAAVAAELPASTGAVVVSRDGGHLVDGLAAGGPAAALRRPVLLANRVDVPVATLEALRDRTGPVWVVGGVAAVGDAALAQVRGTRVAGADRWATAVAAADAGTAAGVTTDLAVVASGETANLVDALAGGSFARPVVLTARTSLPAATASWLSGNGSTLKRAVVLGGAAAVTDATVDAIRSALNKT